VNARKQRFKKPQVTGVFGTLPQVRKVDRPNS
jgi:hypothetical protein